MPRLPFHQLFFGGAFIGISTTSYYFSSNNQENFFSSMLNKSSSHRHPKMNASSSSSSFQNIAFAAAASSQNQKQQDSEAEGQGANNYKAGHWIDTLPEYSADEITEHNGSGDATSGTDRVWIFFRSGVYDITDFLALHPGGGKRLMLAAGSGIEPFWKQFTVHDKPEVFEQLEKFRIGNLKGTKGHKFDPIRDPNAKEEEGGMWSAEPKDRDKAFIPFSTRPYNAEARPEAIAHNAITPNDKFFIRGHLPIPLIDTEDFCLDISGIGMKNDDHSCPTLDELFAKYKEDDQVVTIQCGGNRRTEVVNAYPEKSIKGIKWKSGAISTAKWSGASLRQILLDHAKDPKKLEEMAKKNPGKYHVHFEGADQDVLENYEISIPLEMALDPERDAMVAWKMNGQPIPRDHGFPLRALVPGTVGSRNCKWLEKISVQEEEALGDWQRKDYRKFAPHEKDASNAHLYPAVNDMPVQAAITDTSVIPEQKQAMISGYAYCGGGKDVTKVEVSYDGGKTFSNIAHLSDGGIKQKKGHRWAWKQFYAAVPLSTSSNNKNKGKKTTPTTTSVDAEEKMKVCVRASTDDGEIQPKVGAYNFRGLFYNGYSCVEI